MALRAGMGPWAVGRAGGAPEMAMVPESTQGLNRLSKIKELLTQRLLSTAPINSSFMICIVMKKSLMVIKNCYIR